MKICTTEQEYIDEIASSVQRVCKRYGYLPSILIGQSCLENGYGIRSYWDNPQIEALLKYNNMVGIKSKLLNKSWNEYTVWNGESLTKQTPEVYNGKQVTITGNFRKYDTIERSFADFLLFITYASNYGKGGTPKYGNAVTSIKDPAALIKRVNELGYATGKTYAANVMKIVNKHNLTKYDDLSNVTATIYIPGYKGESAINNTTKSYLQKGNTGNDVKTMQSMLVACDYSCGSSGADGDFGNDTLDALKAFQKDNNLTVNGFYDSKSKEALLNLYNSIKGAKTSNAVSVFLNAVKNVATMAKDNGWVYGDSHSVPPCDDKKISCDRIASRALYDLGYTDQPKGGIVCNQFPTYLSNWGFIETKNKSEIKAGAIVVVGKNNNIEHGFIVESYNPSTDICNKYDAGSDPRIKSGAYFENVKLVEWDDREFIAAWNVPSNLKSSSNSKENNNVSNTIFNRLDYSPVYNYPYYKNKYSDLQKAFGSDKEAYFKHFCTYGMKEGRQASSSFNVQNYKSRYSDLRKAFGNNLPLYYKHYIEFGKSEKRNAK